MTYGVLTAFLRVFFSSQPEFSTFPQTDQYYYLQYFAIFLLRSNFFIGCVSVLLQDSYAGPKRRLEPALRVHAKR